MQRILLSTGQGSIKIYSRYASIESRCDGYLRHEWDLYMKALLPAKPVPNG